jgi:hypothetical protein
MTSRFFVRRQASGTFVKTFTNHGQEGVTVARSEGRAAAGQPVARVVTAGEISAQLREETAEKLRNLAGADLEVEFEVDSGLIGGMVVHLPDRLIDMSMAGRFRSYGRAVQELITTHLDVLENWAKSEEGSAGGETPGPAAGKE